MSNSFSKEETVAFEELLEGFEESLVLSKNVNIYRPNGQSMERSADVIWRPVPYIAQSYDGMDQSSNFAGKTQLSVPATLGYHKSVPWEMSATELRDALQEGRLYEAAKQKLSSDVNVAILNTASYYGSLVVKRSSAASGFDDVAACDALMNESGVPNYDRCLALSSRDYNNMASNLAARYTMTGKPTTAYERAYVGMVSGFDTYKLDYAINKTAAAGGGSLTIDTRSSASNYYTPKATSVAVTGERSNVDNRFQTITISSTTSVVAGDAFTIAGINNCHQITKGDTGSLKTFRVVSVPSSTTLVITPPIISNQGATDAEAQYQNCIVTPAASAAIVFLNTVTKALNPFWQKGSIEIVAGNIVIPADGGVKVMKASTSQGLEVIFQKWTVGETGKTRFRVDVPFGCVNLNPEMNGVIQFSQT